MSQPLLNGTARELAVTLTLATAQAKKLVTYSDDADIRSTGVFAACQDALIHARRALAAVETYQTGVRG